jgi:hypothetical protein
MNQTRQQRERARVTLSGIGYKRPGGEAHPSKRTEGVDETVSLFDALCRLSVSGGLKSILHQPVTLTELYDVKCKSSA